MTTKCTYYISVKCSNTTTVTIKHIKYKTESFVVNGTQILTFNSFANWDGNALKITADNETYITSVQFMLSAVDTLKRIAVRKQLIDNVDLYPARTEYFSKEDGGADLQNPIARKFILDFVPMNIKLGQEGIIRFLTPKVLHSINKLSARP